MSTITEEILFKTLLPHSERLEAFELFFVDKNQCAVWLITCVYCWLY